jgi:hypothetical protein
MTNKSKDYITIHGYTSNFQEEPTIKEGDGWILSSFKISRKHTIKVKGQEKVVYKNYEVLSFNSDVADYIRDSYKAGIPVSVSGEPQVNTWEKDGIEMIQDKIFVKSFTEDDHNIAFGTSQGSSKKVFKSAQKDEALDEEIPF